jgi:hypothetical protein
MNLVHHIKSKSYALPYADDEADWPIKGSAWLAAKGKLSTSMEPAPSRAQSSPSPFSYQIHHTFVQPSGSTFSRINQHSICGSQ